MLEKQLLFKVSWKSPIRVCITYSLSYHRKDQEALEFLVIFRKLDLHEGKLEHLCNDKSNKYIIIPTDIAKEFSPCLIDLEY